MSDMSIIVKNITTVLAVPIIIFGLYVILHGHLTPGGGFAGGAIMATVIALFLVSFGKIKMHKKILSISESLGLLAFIGLALLGFPATFFHNFLANSGLLFGMPIPFGSNPGYIGTGGVTPLMNLAVGLEVFSGLSLIILIMQAGGDKDV